MTGDPAELIDVNEGGVYWWLSKNGSWWNPGEMETRFLFNALRLLHNCALDPDMRDSNGNVLLTDYEWPFTPAYIRQSIEKLGREIVRRLDLEDWQKVELGRMAQNARKAEQVAQIQHEPGDLSP